MLAAHVIIGAYGFWLPNDERGSWSDFVGSWELFRFGPATKTNATRSLAGRLHDRNVRLAAKRALKYPAVQVTGVQARAICRGFATYAERSGLQILACAILPDHIHTVLGRHRIDVKQLVIHLKGEATAQLIDEKIHPFAQLPTNDGRLSKCFSQGEWRVYLDTVADVRRAIRYVENNPLKEGKRCQNWTFVTPFAP